MNWVEGPGLQTVPWIQPSGPFSIPNITEVCLYWGKSLVQRGTRAGSPSEGFSF